MSSSGRPIRTLLLRRIWGSTLVLLVGLSLLYFYQSMREERRELLERAKQQVRYSARKLGWILDSGIAVSEILSASLESHPKSPESLVKDLVSLNVKHHTSVVGIDVVLPGHAFSLDWETGRQHEIATLPGKWWDEIRSTGKPMWDLPEDPEPAADVGAARYCVPIKLDGAVVGAVATMVTLNSLKQDFEILKTEGAAYGFVVSPAGVLATLGVQPKLPDIHTSVASRFVESRNAATGEQVWLAYEAAGTSGLTIILAYPKFAFWQRVLEAELRPLLVVVVGSIALLVILLLISESISVPIEELARTARRISEGELELTLPDPDGGPLEVRELTRTFLVMSRELRRQMAQIAAEAAERERLASQLRIAHDIQVSMLPAQIPRFKWMKIAALSAPALTVGGDFYDLQENHNCLAVTFGDVSGKGVASAIYMAAVVTLLRVNNRRSAHPCDWLSEANQELASDESGFFATGAALLVDDQGHVSMSSAGHYPPLWRRDGRLIEIESAGTLPLGAFHEAHYMDQELLLQPGDVLLFYTDGANEAMNADRALFDDDRLREAFLRGPSEPEAIVQFVRDEIEAFRGNAAQNDDLTLLCLAYRGH